jgi:hypothetical protein
MTAYMMGNSKWDDAKNRAVYRLPVPGQCVFAVDFGAGLAALVADRQRDGVGGGLDHLGPVRAMAFDRSRHRQTGDQFAGVVAHAGGNAAQAGLDFLVVEGDAMAAGAIDFAFQGAHVVSEVGVKPGRPVRLA